MPVVQLEAADLMVFHAAARNVRIVSAQAAGDASVGTEAQAEDRPWWRRAKTWWVFVVGAATIAGAIAAWLVLR